MLAELGTAGKGTQDHTWHDTRDRQAQVLSSENRVRRCRRKHGTLLPCTRSWPSRLSPRGQGGTARWVAVARARRAQQVTMDNAEEKSHQNQQPTGARRDRAAPPLPNAPQPPQARLGTGTPPWLVRAKISTTSPRQHPPASVPPPPPPPPRRDARSASGRGAATLRAVTAATGAARSGQALLPRDGGGGVGGGRCERGGPSWCQSAAMRGWGPA